MSKSFILGFIAGLVLIIASAVAGFQSQQKDPAQKRKEQELALYKTQVVDATPVQFGVLTERQQKHSKLYTSYNLQLSHNKKISKRIKERESTVLGTELLIGLGPAFESAKPEDFFAEIVKTSDVIIRGKVVKKTSQITEDDFFIFTDYDVTVSEILKNNLASPIDLGNTVIVTRPGGKIVVDGVVLEFKDHGFLPLPVRGNEVVLFLKFVPDTGAYQTVESSGSYEIVGNSLQPLTKEPFPVGVLDNSNSLLSMIRTILKSK